MAPPRELTILPNVKYRIQNVDLGYVLERRDDNVVLRQPKEDNKEQEWIFVKPNPANSIYDIRNMEDTDTWYLSDAQAGFTTNEYTGTQGVQDPLQVSSSAARYWRFILKSLTSSNDFYIMSNASSKLFVYAILPNAVPALKLQSISSIKPGTIFLTENYQWRLIEVSPASLPDGTSAPDGTMRFRIRTLNGNAIHSVVGKKTLSIANEGTGDQREFVIVSKGNGKCTILNAKEKKYINATKVNDQWNPTLETVPAFEWDIRKTSEFTYSICAELEISKDKYGISFYDSFSFTVKDQNVILKPMKSAHNQFWLIEPADAPPPDKATGGGSEIVPGSGLKPGEYELRIPGTNSAIAVNINGAVVDVFDGKPRNVNQFRVALSPSGQPGEIVISYDEDDDVLAYLAPSGRQLAGQKSPPFTWTVERDQTSGNYYIKSGNDVLSAPENGNKFVIKPKSNPTTDLWQFK